MKSDSRSPSSPSVRKFQLRRETVRSLTDAQLLDVHGGIACVANDTMHTQISLARRPGIGSLTCADDCAPTTCGR